MKEGLDTAAEEEENAAREEDAEEARQTREAKNFEQGKAAAEKYEDFADVVNGANPNLNVLSKEVADAILDSDFGCGYLLQGRWRSGTGSTTQYDETNGVGEGIGEDGGRFWGYRRATAQTDKSRI